MKGARAANLDMTDTIDSLQRAGYCVWQKGSNAQIELSACAGTDGRWQLADISEFPKVCGSGAPPSKSGQCVRMKRGPSCKTNSDCVGISGCVRCAKSGFCTDVKLAGQLRSLLPVANVDLVSNETAALLVASSSSAAAQEYRSGGGSGLLAWSCTAIGFILLVLVAAFAKVRSRSAGWQYEALVDAGAKPDC